MTFGQKYSDSIAYLSLLKNNNCFKTLKIEEKFMHDDHLS